MRLINSLADAEACANALTDVFYEALMDQLIRENKPSAKPSTEKHRLFNIKRETMSEQTNNIQTKPEEMLLTEQELQFCELYVNGGDQRNAFDALNHIDIADIARRQGISKLSDT